MASGAPSHSRDRLGRVISARVEAWGGAELPLERLTFGTTEPDAIAAAIDAWCATFLGAGIEQYHFFDSSSGSVHGVRLRDGRDVVVKVHRPDLTLAYLDAISTVQRAFAEHGLPAPRPLTGPVPYGPVHITAETMLASGPPADGHDPAVRAALARGLARVVVVGRALELDGTDALHHPTAMPPDALYPPPHSARFDFEATAAGAEWIDAYARRARAALAAGDPGPDVLVHGDWRIENANVAAGEVVAIYDWDSVCVEPELFAVATVGGHLLRGLVASGRRALPDERRDPRVHRRVRDRTRCPVLRRRNAASSPLAWSMASPTARAANTPTTSRRSPTRSRRSYAASATRCSITDWTRCGPDKTNRRG